MRPPDSTVDAYFTLDFGDAIVGAFRECTGIGSESEVVDYKAAARGGKFVMKRIPGHLKYTEIILRRGITSGMELWTWRKLVEQGQITKARRNMSIRIYAADGQQIAQWNLNDAWPSKLVTNQANNESAVEVLTIVHEGYSRVQ